jgi:AraC-like DNA-binding protein
LAAMERLNESRTSALLTEPFAAAFTTTAAASPHTEHAVAVIIGIDGDVAVGTGAATLRARAIAVAADTAYSARSQGPSLKLSFDPELCPGVAAFAREQRLTRVDGLAGIARAHRAALTTRATLAGIGGEIADRLAGSAPRRDRRIARLLDELRDPDADRAQAVARAGVSPGHVAALFVRDVGVAMRTFLLWRRLLHGLARVGPLDLTASAHAAGFADLAHFSRTCRRMLGVAPSQLQASLVR